MKMVAPTFKLPFSLLCVLSVLFFPCSSFSHDGPEHDIEELTAQIEKEGASADLLLQRAIEYLVIKKTAEAIRDLEQAQELEGGSPTILRELGRAALAFAIAIVVGAIIARVHLRSRGAAVFAFGTALTAWTTGNLYLLDGAGTLNALLPHVVAALVFIAGLLAGGLHSDRVIHTRRVTARG